MSGRNWSWSNLLLSIIGIIAVVLIASSLVFGRPFEWDYWRDNGSANNDQAVIDDLMSRLAMLENNAGDQQVTGSANNDQAVIDDLMSRLAMLENNAGDQQVVTTAIGDVNDTSMVEPCPSTTQVNSDIGTDVQSVGGEACAYTLRTAAIGNTGATCKVGYFCTFTVGDTFVFDGDGTRYAVTAGTVRYKASYPKGDPARDNACGLTSKENAFGLTRNPPFPVFPGNFSCEGVVPGPLPATVDNGSQPNQPNNTGKVCPAKDQAGQVARLVGGNANEWHRLNEGQWKRVSSVSANLTAPWGTLDWWDGAYAHAATKKANNAFEATWNCDK
jgi:hypothetical protein